MAIMMTKERLNQLIAERKKVRQKSKKYVQNVGRIRSKLKRTYRLTKQLRLEMSIHLRWCVAFEKRMDNLLAQIKEACDHDSTD